MPCYMYMIWIQSLKVWCAVTFCKWCSKVLIDWLILWIISRFFFEITLRKVTLLVYIFNILVCTSTIIIEFYHPQKGKPIIDFITMWNWRHPKRSILRQSEHGAFSVIPNNVQCVIFSEGNAYQHHNITNHSHCKTKCTPFISSTWDMRKIIKMKSKHWSGFKRATSDTLRILVREEWLTSFVVRKMEFALWQSYTFRCAGRRLRIALVWCKCILLN